MAMISEEDFGQVLVDARKALLERNFDHLTDLLLIRHINPDLTRNSASFISTVIITEVYNDAKYNDAMTAFADLCFNTLTVDIFCRYHPMITQSIFTRAIEFDNEPLFDLLASFNIALYMNTEIEVYKAIDRCPNPKMIQKCFFGNFLDLRYPGDCNFLAKEAPEFVEMIHTLRVTENLEQQQLSLVQHLMFRNIPGRIIPSGTFSRMALMQHFLKRAMYHRNRPVCHYLLPLCNPSYEFSRNDYILFVEATQREIRTLVTLARNSDTVMNALPNELQDLIFNLLI